MDSRGDNRSHAVQPDSPVQSQERDLSELLSGNVHPLSIKLKDLNAEWRRVTIHSAATVSDNISVNVSGNSSSTSQNNLVGALAGSRLYVTKGNTASAAGRHYLLAYHLPGNSADFGMLVRALATKTPPTAAALTPDTVLPLALLDLQSIGTIDDVRPFDLQSEIADYERAVRTWTDLFKAQGGTASTNQPAPAKPAPEK